MITSGFRLTWSLTASCHSQHSSGQCLLSSESLSHHFHGGPLGPQQLQRWSHPDYLLVISLGREGMAVPSEMF